MKSTGIFEGEILFYVNSDAVRVREWLRMLPSLRETYDLKPLLIYFALVRRLAMP